MNFLSKIKFLIKKPGVVIVTGSGGKETKEAILHVLKQHPQIGRKVLISESDLKDPADIKEIKFLSGRASQFILVAVSKSEALAEKEITERIGKLTKTIPPRARLVLNFDNPLAKEMTDNSGFKTLTFGFQAGADFQASDIMQNGRDASSSSVAGEPVLGTNFKINHKENTVPVWLNGFFDKEQIYSVLAAVCVGTAFDLNLIEISQALKDYQKIA